MNDLKLYATFINTGYDPRMSFEPNNCVVLETKRKWNVDSTGIYEEDKITSGYKYSAGLQMEKILNDRIKSLIREIFSVWRSSLYILSSWMLEIQSKLWQSWAIVQVLLNGTEWTYTKMQIKLFFLWLPIPWLFLRIVLPRDTWHYGEDIGRNTAWKSSYVEKRVMSLSYR